MNQRLAGRICLGLAILLGAIELGETFYVPWRYSDLAHTTFLSSNTQGADVPVWIRLYQILDSHSALFASITCFLAGAGLLLIGYAGLSKPDLIRVKAKKPR